MTTTNYPALCALTIVGALGACTTPQPGQLIAAREAYAQSSGGLAARLTPTELYEAKKALDKAEREYRDNGDTPMCRDYAYIALRKTERADVMARTDADRQTIDATTKAGIAVRDNQVKNTESALATTREQLKDERRDSVEQNKLLQTTTDRLDDEKAARHVAESKLAGAMKDLATIAAVREDARGLVITLSGGVLFASNRFALLNTAMTKLDQVAEALKAQDAEKTMIVEGHTDSQGSDATNVPLSNKRAAAVRDYLVLKGVAADKITAIGMGSSRPITDNANAENRANNRRVEIIISSPKLGAR